jgi:hypothetical protein
MAEVDLADVRYALQSLEGLGCRVVRSGNGQQVDPDEVMWLVTATIENLMRARAVDAQLRVMEIGRPRPTLVMGDVAARWLSQAEQARTFMFDAQLPRPRWNTATPSASFGPRTVNRWDF